MSAILSSCLSSLTQFCEDFNVFMRFHKIQGPSWPANDLEITAYPGGYNTDRNQNAWKGEKDIN